MRASVDWLRRWNVSVGVLWDNTGLFGGQWRPKRGRVVCLILLSVISAKSVGVRACRDHHGGISIALLYTFVTHDICWEILSKTQLTQTRSLLTLCSFRKDLWIDTLSSWFEAGLRNRLAQGRHQSSSSFIKRIRFKLTIVGQDEFLISKI